MDNKKVEIKKVEKTFGKRFLIGSVSKNQENENKNELKGVFEKYFIDDECEMSFMKIIDSIDYEIINSKKTSDNIIRFMYFLEGKSLFMLHSEDARKYDIKKDDILIHKLGVTFEKYVVSSKNLEYILIDLNIDKLCLKFLNVSDKDEIRKWKDRIFELFRKSEILKTKINMEMSYLLKKIKNIAMIKNINEYLNFKVRIEELMFLTLETCINFEEYINVNVDNFEIVKKARKILDRKNITQPIRIGELCKIMNKTRYQLQISFEKVEGIGIFEYIQKRRMEYSKNLLITTNKSILEISNEVGYKNPSKFSKIFKKYYGILPSKYRNKD